MVCQDFQKNMKNGIVKVCVGGIFFEKNPAFKKMIFMYGQWLVVINEYSCIFSLLQIISFLCYPEF
jgi:hypothetical protein